MPPFKNQKSAKPKNARGTIKRLLKYLGKFKLALTFVFIGILLSSVVSIINTYFVSILIDDYITPYIGNWAGIVKNLSIAVLVMGSFYLVGILSLYMYNRLMVYISSRTLNRIRDDMFRRCP